MGCGVILLQFLLVSSLAVFSGGTAQSGVAQATQCDGGVCCDNGRFRAAQTVCRARRDECDVAEFCSGTHGSCPSDRRASDGEPCASGKGRCLEGKCALTSGSVGKNKRKRSLNPGDKHSHGRAFVHHHNRNGHDKSKDAKNEGLQLEVIILLSVLLPLAILAAISVTVWLWYTKRLCFDKPIQRVSYHELARTRQQSRVLDHPNVRYDICPDEQ